MSFTMFSGEWGHSAIKSKHRSTMRRSSRLIATKSAMAEAPAGAPFINSAESRLLFWLLIASLRQWEPSASIRGE